MTGLKKRFKTRYIAVLIKMLSQFILLASNRPKKKIEFISECNLIRPLSWELEPNAFFVYR